MDLSVTHEEKKIVRHLTIIIVTLGLFLSWPMVHKRLTPKDPIQATNEAGLTLPDLIGKWQGSDSSTYLTFERNGNCVASDPTGKHTYTWKVFDVGHPLLSFPYEYEGDSKYLVLSTPNNGAHIYYQIATLESNKLALAGAVDTSKIATFTKIP